MGTGSNAYEFSQIPTYTAPLAWWHYENVRLPDITSESAQDSFIGMLSAAEAERMKNELNLYKKRFDEDLNKRNKVLFRE
jgi:hypothetical protein